MAMDDPHLKPRQEYIDRYDRITVNRCRDAEKSITAEYLKKHMKEGTDETELTRTAKVFNELHMWGVVGESYRQKDEIISRWMREDEEHDRYYANAQPPRGINCLTCGREMFVTMKHLQSHLDKPDRVLYMFDCTLNHMPRRAFYDDGEEFRRDKPLCPKCRTPYEEKDETTDDAWKTVCTCPNCGNTETSEIERTVGKETHDPDYEKDRARFCNEETGRKYVDWMQSMERLGEILKESKQKEDNKELYDEVAKIKRLKIIELEQLLAPILEKADYAKLQFKDPEITKDVVVPFTVHDVRQGREDRASCQDLQKLIKKTLEGTNWRLMTDGVSYRLGMLEGRFKAYEREEDLVKLVEKSKKP